MTTTLSTFSSAEIALKWQEPYLSQGINRDFNAAARVGIARGFKLTTSGSPLTVTVQADATWGDHTAVLRTSTGYGLAVFRTGNFDLSLSAFASKTVVIALNVTYVPGSTTTGVITGYQLLPVDEYTGAPEKPYLVVLGTVTVPASGVIPATSISDDKRSEMWEAASPAEIIPVQFLRNTGFEQSDTLKSQYSVWYWTRDSSSLATVNYWYTSSADPASGLTHLQLDYTGAVGAVTSSLIQPLMLRISGGDAFRLNAKVKGLKTSTGGTLQFRLHFLNETGGVATGSPVSYTVPLTAIDSTYRTVSTQLVAPAGGVGGAGFLSHIEILDSGLTAGSDGAFIRIDDVELWLDKRTARTQVRAFTQPEVLTTALALHPDPGHGSTSNFLTDIAKSLLLWLDPSTTEATVTAQRKDGGTSNHPFLEWKGRARIGAGVATGVLPFLSTPYDDVASGVVPITALWESAPADGVGVRVRLYVNSIGEVFFTTNAGALTNTTLTWRKDVAGKPAWKFTLGATGSTTTPKLEFRPLTPDTDWDDLSWTRIWSPWSTAPANVQTATFSVTVDLGWYPINTTSSAFNANLPDPTINKGRTIIFKDVVGKFATNALTLVRFGAEKIEGLSVNFKCDADYQELRLYCDGVDYWLT